MGLIPDGFLAASMRNVGADRWSDRIWGDAV